MILEDQELFEILRNEAPDWVKTARKKANLYDIHVNGDEKKVKDYLAKIDTFENDKQLKLRQKMAVSNRFLMKDILRPIDKVFSAKGGVRKYDVSKSKRESFNDAIRNVKKGVSIQQYIKKTFAPKMLTDPSGVLFMEWDGEKTWPSQKSINEIHCYKADGRFVEFIVFAPHVRHNSDGEQLDGLFYRVVDEQSDRVYQVLEDETPRLLDDPNEFFENPWGRVPAIINSDLMDNTLTHYESPLNAIVEVADKYLRTNTIKNVHELLHGFPYFWMYAKNCQACKGTGYIQSADGERHETCSSCDGVGKSMKKDVSDAALLNTPKRKEDPVIAPDVAGYVVPPIEIPKEQREELNWLRDAMHFTMWGTTEERDGKKSETATGRYLDTEPVNDSLKAYSECFEQTEAAVVDFVGEYVAQSAYKGSTIIYGNRYMIEKPDQLWKKYLEAKQKKAPESILNQMYLEYLESQYSNDTRNLVTMHKAMKVEPFFHHTASEIKEQVPKSLYLQKIVFNEFWVTLEQDEIIQTEAAKLKEQLKSYAEESFDSEEIDREQPPEE